MGNNGRKLLHIQSQVSDMLAAVGEYIDRFDVRSDEEGYHVIISLCVPKNGTLSEFVREHEMGSGLQIALERVRESTMTQCDDEEVVAAVEVKLEEVISPRFVASNGVTTSVAEQPKEARKVVRKYQQINHVPLTRDGIKNQIDKEED